MSQESHLLRAVSRQSHSSLEIKDCSLTRDLLLTVFHATLDARNFVASLTRNWAFFRDLTRCLKTCLCRGRDKNSVQWIFWFFMLSSNTVTRNLFTANSAFYIIHPWDVTLCCLVDLLRILGGRSDFSVRPDIPKIEATDLFETLVLIY
jgi:hypothetical protein